MVARQKNGPKPGAGWVWLVLLLIFVVGLYFASPIGRGEELPTLRHYIGLGCLALFLPGIYIVVFVLNRIWRWSFLANRPLHELTLGQTQAAEDAFHEGLEYAGQ